MGAAKEHCFTPYPSKCTHPLKVVVFQGCHCALSRQGASIRECPPQSPCSSTPTLRCKSDLFHRLLQLRHTFPKACAGGGGERGQENLAVTVAGAWAEVVVAVSFTLRQGGVELRDGGELGIATHSNVLPQHLSEAGQPRDVSECCVVVDAKESPNTGQRGESVQGGECCVGVDAEVSPNTGQRGESSQGGECCVAVDVEVSTNTL